MSEIDDLRSELAETRKALEAAKGASFAEFRNHAGTISILESTRAELAKAEARVKAAVEHLEDHRAYDGDKVALALEALRG